MYREQTKKNRTCQESNLGLPHHPVCLHTVPLSIPAARARIACVSIPAAMSADRVFACSRVCTYVIASNNWSSDGSHDVGALPLGYTS